MRARGRANDQGRRGILKWVAILVTGLLLQPANAGARHRHHHGYPAYWIRQAACIRSHEGWWTANTGNGYYGAYQFLDQTWDWHVAHPRPLRHWPGRADLASPAQQTFIAWRTWIYDGRSWREWGTAGICGLR